MTRLLAVDPGYAAPGSACAYFVDGELRSVFYWDWRDAFPLVADAIVIEKPQEDDRSGHVGDSYAKLVKAYHAAVLACSRAPRKLTPRQWKGSCPKPQHHARLWARLTQHERNVLGGEATERRITEACERGALNRWSRPGAVYYRGWKGHNELDSAALGCFALGRLTK